MSHALVYAGTGRKAFFREQLQAQGVRHKIERACTFDSTTAGQIEARNLSGVICEADRQDIVAYWQGRGVAVVTVPPAGELPGPALPESTGPDLELLASAPPELVRGDVSGDMSSVTFIVKTVDRPECLHELLKSVRGCYPESHILVADDSAVPYPQVCEEFGARHERLPEDVGAAVGYNWLVDHVDTEYLILGDDDFVYQTGGRVDQLVAWVQAGVLDLMAGQCIKPGVKRQNYEMTLSIEDRVLHTRRIPLAEGPCRADVVLNFFAARTDEVCRSRWTPDLKVYRHIDFFLRAKGYRPGEGHAPTHEPLRVGYHPGVFVHHRPTRPTNYMAKRNGRQPEYQNLFLELWDFVEVRDAGSIIRHRDL